MRHQNQNNQDDQRSIGSIGYIGGNIGYMGSMTMEYPYEHQNSHFQLWKPFFPRGEAPPPYEVSLCGGGERKSSESMTIGKNFMIVL
jgi:hypothetical protein